MNTMHIAADASDAQAQALAVLQRGGLVALPTDTVYGVAALISQPEAIERLYAVKGRQHTKAIAVLLGAAEQLDRVAQQPSVAAQRLAARFWPGALTLVVPRRPELPANLSPSATVGVRVPAHALIQRLLLASGPLAVTSANRSGEPDALDAAAVLAQLGGGIELLLDGGRTPGAVPSTVVDTTLNPPQILRAGPIGAAQILAALQAA